MEKYTAATPTAQDLAALMCGGFRKFNPEKEDIRELVVRNGLQPYMWDRRYWTNVPFQHSTYNCRWDWEFKKVAEQNEMVDPDAVFIYWDEQIKFCCVCIFVQWKDFHGVVKQSWDTCFYMPGCCTGGLKTVDEILAKIEWETKMLAPKKKA